MKLTNITLERIKSYDNKTTVGLGDGVTAILGENGAGKSTIAEAVGFALFDSLPHTQQEFVREGESSGTVWVTFEAEDGTEYTVRRRAGRGGYDVINENAGTELELDGKSAVVGWLESAFNIDGKGDIDLSTLWERCIGVAQTRFLSDFRDTEKARRDKFDPLLGIDVYEKAYSTSSGTDLKAPVDEFEERLETATQRIQNLDGRLENLPSKRTEAEQHRDEIDRLETRVASKREELKETETEFETLDELADHRDELTGQLQELDGKLGEKREQVKDAREELKEARKAAEIIAANEADYQRYEEVEEELERLRERKRERDRLETQRQKKDRTLHDTKQELNQTEADAQDAREARGTMEELEASYDRYEELDRTISENNGAEEELKRVTEGIERIDNEKLPAARSAVSKKERKITALESKQELASKASTIREKRSSLDARRDQLETTIDELNEQRERLLAVEIQEEEGSDKHNHESENEARAQPECPTCNRPMDGELRDDVVGTLDANIQEANAEIEEIDRRLPEVKSRLEEAQEAQEAIAGLDNEREWLAELKEKVDNLEDKREELVQQRDKREDEVAELERLREEQDDLESDYEAYQTAELTLETKRGALDAIDEKHEAVVKAAHALARIERKLQSYKGLDEVIDEQEQIKTETSEAHQKYLENKHTAETFDDRASKVETRYVKIEELERERRATQTTLTEMEDEFDAERHTKLDEQIDILNEQLTRKEEQLSSTQDQLNDVEATIGRLETIADQRDRWQETHVQLERDLAFAEAVRSGVREAGPKMRELIASRIGERANTIFQMLRGTGRESLSWDATYQIIVQDGSQRKPFGTLSGGEKMAAALAVRLAIMEQVSPLDIAFLDEPTANLDSEKKANLVRQLETLDAFEQLCVVSHDDTFESMTEYTVTLEKENRETQVVSDAG